MNLYAQNRQAVMLRGNTWVTENPAFSDGTVTSLFGEYCVEIPGAEIPGSQYTFTVRVTGEPRILTSGGWKPRPGSASLLQRKENGATLIGFLFSGGEHLGSWTVMFGFPVTGEAEQPPAGMQPAAGISIPENILDDADINRLINEWTERFQYFFSLVKFASDMSLPAVVMF
jgi:hypothetical protein